MCKGAEDEDRLLSLPTYLRIQRHATEANKIGIVVSVPNIPCEPSGETLKVTHHSLAIFHVP